MAGRSPRPEQCLHILAFLHGERVEILDSAWASARDASSFKYGDRLLGHLVSLATEYWGAHGHRRRCGRPGGVRRQGVRGEGVEDGDGQRFWRQLKEAGRPAAYFVAVVQLERLRDAQGADVTSNNIAVGDKFVTPLAGFGEEGRPRRSCRGSGTDLTALRRDHDGGFDRGHRALRGARLPRKASLRARVVTALGSHLCSIL